jgi:hypothetical protein
MSAIPPAAALAKWLAGALGRAFDSKYSETQFFVYVHNGDADWKLDGGKFSKDEIRYLTDLSKGHGNLITHVYDDGECEVTTSEQ